MMQTDYLSEVRRPGQTANPLFNFLGIRVVEISAEETVLELPLRPDFRQGAGVTAGGVIATLADEAMAHAVLANLQPGESTATIEMNLRFLSPIQEGAARAIARVIKKGRKVATVEAEVRDENDRVLARAGASFIILDK
jgi:uncharacterized protein (TIGR00369 family)